MIGAIAAGIAAVMIAITLYHARAGHRIPWKNHTLYVVTLETRSVARVQRAGPHPEYPPFALTHWDAKALYASTIPAHAVMMYRSAQIITPRRAGLEPFSVSTRVTTADFFAPFLYGSGWSRGDDDTPADVVVLSRLLNQKLFGGVNSVR